MNDDNRRLAIADEVAHGASALRAAHLLRDSPLWNDALSRLYYALFHYASALLLTEGIEPTSNTSVPYEVQPQESRQRISTADCG